MTDSPRRAQARVLLLSMYPLDKGLWGATTRITQLRAALSRKVDLDVVAGRRTPRAGRLLRYAAPGRMRGLAGIYVENATILPGPIDLAFLALARVIGIPILTYVRDAQQLFPEYYRGDSIRRVLSRALFLPATRLLMAISSQVAFPSRGLALAVLRDPGRAESAGERVERRAVDVDQRNSPTALDEPPGDGAAHSTGRTRDQHDRHAGARITRSAGDATGRCSVSVHGIHPWSSTIALPPSTTSCWPVT